MPRMGIGMPIVSETSEAAVLGVEDFVFLNDVSGELTPVDTSSRTNKLVQSQTFKTTWATNNAAIPNDLFEAPDNSQSDSEYSQSSDSEDYDDVRTFCKPIQFKNLKDKNKKLSY